MNRSERRGEVSLDFIDRGRRLTGLVILPSSVVVPFLLPSEFWDRDLFALRMMTLVMLGFFAAAAVAMIGLRRRVTVDHDTGSLVLHRAWALTPSQRGVSIGTPTLRALADLTAITIAPVQRTVTTKQGSTTIIVWEVAFECQSGGRLPIDEYGSDDTARATAGRLADETGLPIRARYA